ncbi:hypothetical protein [Paracoccus marcusii]|nr:hypothetical protein [Paracoccus marcusii]
MTVIAFSLDARMITRQRRYGFIARAAGKENARHCHTGPGWYS